MSLKLNHTFIGKDDLVKIFIPVCSIVLGPRKSFLFVLSTDELAVAASMKGPAQRGATLKDSSERDAIATANQERVELHSGCFVVFSHLFVNSGLYLCGNLGWTSRSIPSSYATCLPVLL